MSFTVRARGGGGRRGITGDAPRPGVGVLGASNFALPSLTYRRSAHFFQQGAP